MIMVSALYYGQNAELNFYRNNILWTDMLPHSNTLSWILHALAEKQQIPILQSWVVRLDRGSIYHTLGEHADYYTFHKFTNG